MGLDRRLFMRAVPALAAGVVSCSRPRGQPQGQAFRIENGNEGEWDRVRAAFEISPEIADLSALLVAAHPRPVREAIERYRRGLDANPTIYLESNYRRNINRVLEAAARYLGARAEDIALTDSTTAGLALVYHGFRLREGQEFLVSEHNYYSTVESVRLASERTGARVREFPIYRDSAAATEAEMVDNLAAAVGPDTRVVAVTWVHSSTGVKLPIGRMAEALEEINRGRDPGDRALLVVDGVHGFGVENVEMNDLGCDFFVAGCHKWLFGPRGTGIVWGSRRGWEAVVPTIPSFLDNSVRRASLEGREPSGRTTGQRLSPGGFKPFEHQWAMAEAFEFHRNVGKAKIAARTHALSRQLKEGLAAMRHVRLYTPMVDELSAGVVCFDVRGLTPGGVVSRLRRRNIVATTTPYAPSYARLTPSIRNSPAEIEAALDAIRALG